MRAGDAGQLRSQLDRGGSGDEPASVAVVEPVNAKEVEGVGGIRIDVLQAARDGRRNGRGIPEFGECRQRDPGLAEARKCPPVDVAIDQACLKPQARHDLRPS